LLDGERDFVRAASPERIREFATGRACARAALAEFGLEGLPILVNPDRSPAWPSQCVGSITHTTGYCAAAVARTDQCAALGIDAERIGKIEDDLLPLICTQDEMATLSADVETRQWQTTAIFCAKEAYYKAQFCLTKQWLDFTDVEISLHANRGSFTGQVRAVDDAAPVTRFDGAFRLMDDLLIAAVCIQQINNDSGIPATDGRR
jgi:4'-phosphopantetheinyl transferase EntD